MKIFIFAEKEIQIKSLFTFFFSDSKVGTPFFVFVVFCTFPRHQSLTLTRKHEHVDNRTKTKNAKKRSSSSSSLVSSSRLNYPPKEKKEEYARHGRY